MLDFAYPLPPELLAKILCPKDWNQAYILKGVQHTQTIVTNNCYDRESKRLIRVVYTFFASFIAFTTLYVFCLMFFCQLCVKNSVETKKIALNNAIILSLKSLLNIYFTISSIFTLKSACVSVLVIQSKTSFERVLPQVKKKYVLCHAMSLFVWSALSRIL